MKTHVYHGLVKMSFGFSIKVSLFSFHHKNNFFLRRNGAIPKYRKFLNLTRSKAIFSQTTWLKSDTALTPFNTEELLEATDKIKKAAGQMKFHRKLSDQK